jgi:hypothetical protein
MPLANQHLLLYILDMLGLFLEHAPKTMMDIKGLAVIFTPGLMGHCEKAHKNPELYKNAHRVIEFLITNQASFSMPRTGGDKTAGPSSEAPGSSSNDDPMGEDHSVHQRHSRYSASSSYFLNGRRRDSAEMVYHFQPGSGTQTPASGRTGLRRSKTTPSKRSRYGSSEPTQIVHVNRTASHGGQLRK